MILIITVVGLIIIFFVGAFWGFVFSKRLGVKINETISAGALVAILMCVVDFLLHNDLLSGLYFYTTIFLGWSAGAILHKRRKSYECKKN